MFSIIYSWPEWKNIPEQNKEELALFSDHDGEFWIPFEFVLANFWMLHICNLSPLPFQEFSNEDDDETLWRTIYNIEAEWVRGSTAGGSDPLSGKYIIYTYYLRILFGLQLWILSLIFSDAHSMNWK